MRIPITKIEVTQENIEKGVPQDPYKCPVALALEYSSYVEPVKENIREITYNGQTYQTPLEVRRFMRAFDQGDYVSPFQFDLHK